MKSRARVLVTVLALCGTLGCSAGSPDASPASPAPAPTPETAPAPTPAPAPAPTPAPAPAPTPESALSEGNLDYPEPPGLESLSSLEELEKAPTFTPYTVRPDIKNQELVAEMLEKEYPPLLREQRVGGTAGVWFLLDADGGVRKIDLNESTGNLQLDQAALRVAAFMEFTPAYNKDKPVPVWISLPITFSVKR